MRDLGVLFDSKLTMKKHIAKVAAVCFFHIRRLRHIRRHVGKDVTIRLALALITLRLDYCNSVFAGLPQSTFEPLQRVQKLGLCLTYVIVTMSRHIWCNYTGYLSGHECSLNSAHWCTPFTTKDLHRISHSQTLYRLLRQQLLAAVFDHLPLQTMLCRGHFPSSAIGPSRMQVMLPRTAFQITFVASPHLQPSEDIWKRFYSLKFLILPRTFNIVMSTGHLCKWTQNRRWWWWW